MATRICAVADCSRPAVTKGYCQRHYVRWRKYGDPSVVRTHEPRKRRDPAVRFWEKVDRSGGPDACWPWLASKQPGDYGKFYYEGRLQQAHRVAFILTYGLIPADVDTDHLCRRHDCCNPRHLEVVSHRENILRGEAFSARYARQTHCLRGHELTGDNIYLWRGSRYCRACRRERKRAARPPTALRPPGERTHCPHGHPYDEANTYHYRGHRFCRACQRARRERQR